MLGFVVGLRSPIFMEMLGRPLAAFLLPGSPSHWGRIPAEGTFNTHREQERAVPGCCLRSYCPLEPHSPFRGRRQSDSE